MTNLQTNLGLGFTIAALTVVYCNDAESTVAEPTTTEVPTVLRQLSNL